MTYLGIIAGAAMSFAFSFTPGLSTWYDQQDKNTKKGVMAVVVLVITLVVFGVGCLGVGVEPYSDQVLTTSPGDTCTKVGFLALMSEFIMQLTLIAAGNQMFYAFSPSRSNSKND